MKPLIVILCGAMLLTVPAPILLACPPATVGLSAGGYCGTSAALSQIQAQPPVIYPPQASFGFGLSGASYGSLSFAQQAASLGFDESIFLAQQDLLLSQQGIYSGRGFRRGAARREVRRGNRRGARARGRGKARGRGPVARGRGGRGPRGVSRPIGKGRGAPRSSAVRGGRGGRGR